jgi:hypothetical protein
VPQHEVKLIFSCKSIVYMVGVAAIELTGQCVVFKGLFLLLVKIDPLRKDIGIYILTFS